MHMEIQTQNYKIIFDQDIDYHLLNFLDNNGIQRDNIFLLTDSNVEQHVLPQIKLLADVPRFVMEPGEKNKNLDTARQVWEFLARHRADRNSVLINLGGGVVTDLGGFVASTYKRGIRFINIPTTLLAQVDASVGGKTGIDLLSYKNMIGTFSDPALVLINTLFLQTLDRRQFLSGYAEMIKHALITGEGEWTKIKSFSVDGIDYEYLAFLVKKSVEIKYNIVRQDPTEKGLRKVLNFGHTIGHGIETLLLSRGQEILHGEAVAIGLVAEIYLSNIKFILNIEKVFEISSFITSRFPAVSLTYDDYNQIYELLLQDKKNRDGKIMFTLLRDIGDPVIDQTCSKGEIFEALNFYYQFK